MRGRSTEYRRFPLARLEADLRTLGEAGLTTITFADEDFFGGSLDDVERRAVDLASVLARLPWRFRFDVSATIRSLCDNRDTSEQAARRRELLQALVNCGLNKVFLGIESGSPTQLKRYVKGHSADEAAGACDVILRSGARLEIGWIMFDPLCTRAEVRENLEFLRDNDLAQYASALTSELRVHVGSGYHRLLDVEERRRGLEIYGRELDPDTLSYPFIYLDDEIARMVEVVREWNARNRAVYYPLKSLTRFGEGGALGRELGTRVAGLVATYRDRCADSLWRYADAADLDSGSISYAEEMRTAVVDLAAAFVSLHDDAGGAPEEHPAVEAGLAAARDLLTATSIPV